MKNYFLNITLLALCVTALYSCSKSTDPYDIPVNYYLATNDNGAISVFKDTAKLFSYSSSVSTVTDLVVINGKVEICGSVTENLQSRPAIWVDGVLSKPLKDSIGCFNSMYVSGSERYLLANISGKNGTYGALVKNDQVVFAAPDSVLFDKLGIGASGDFYVAGRVKNAITGTYNKAYLWRIKASDYTLAQLPLEIMSSDKELVINDLSVGAYNIAVALEKKESATETSAWGWLYDNRVYSSGDCVKLADADSRSTAVMFAGGYWFTGGARPGLEYYNATIWRNGITIIPMENQCNPGGSYVALLYYGGYNTYECVSSPGQIQLCRNGQLRLMLSCPATMKPAAWMVVRQ